MQTWLATKSRRRSVRETSPGFGSSNAAVLPILLSLLAIGTFAGLLWLERRDIVAGFRSDAEELLYWTMVILLVNLLHVDLGSMQFTLDLPLLIAVSLLYDPAVAGLVAFAGSADVREFRGRVGIWRALYNRGQIAVAVLLASASYHFVSSSLESWPQAFVATGVATATFVVLNGVFVSTYVNARGEGAFGAVFRRLHVGNHVEFALTYFAYGILAYALSRLFHEMGAWSIPLFLAPIVVAHAALVRAERLQALANRLKARERLLERLTDQIEDERKDERVRIASGLHDDVLQSLIRVSQLGRFLDKAVVPGSQGARDAAELVALGDSTIQTLREVVGGLSHSPIGRGGLEPTLRSLAQDLQLGFGVRILVRSAQSMDIPGTRQLLLYQVAKEGLMNALKHAEPSEVRIDLRTEGPFVVLGVEDNGTGFNPSDVDESEHFGIGLMRERLHMAGGFLLYESRDGRTRMEARVRRETHPDRPDSAR